VDFENKKISARLDYSIFFPGHNSPRSSQKKVRGFRAWAETVHFTHSYNTYMVHNNKGFFLQI